MEKEKIEYKGTDDEIIGYRVERSNHLLCPSHYDLSVKILGVHKIELPAQALKKGDVKTFICSRCEDERNKGRQIEEMERKEKERVGFVRDAIISNLKKMRETRRNRTDDVDMIGEIDVMRRKARFIKKTVRLAAQGRPLTRKNILTLRDFFDGLGERLDTIRDVLTLGFFDALDYSDMLARQARGHLCTLPQHEQEALRTTIFGLLEKDGHADERTGGVALPS